MMIMMIFLAQCGDWPQSGMPASASAGSSYINKYACITNIYIYIYIYTNMHV